MRVWPPMSFVTTLIMYILPKKKQWFSGFWSLSSYPCLLIYFKPQLCMNHGDLTSQFDQSSSGTIFPASISTVCCKWSCTPHIIDIDSVSIYFQEIQSLGIVFSDLDSWGLYLYSSVCMGHGCCLCYPYLGDFAFKAVLAKSKHYKIDAEVEPAFSS